MLIVVSSSSNGKKAREPGARKNLAVGVPTHIYMYVSIHFNVSINNACVQEEEEESASVIEVNVHGIEIRGVLVPNFV